MNKEYKQYLVQEIALNKAKRYKNNKKELEFDYLPKKVFDKLEKEQDTTFAVVGSIKLNETNKTKVDTVTIFFNDRLFTYELIEQPENPYDKDERKESNVMGYLLVGEDTYVSIIKSNFIFIILLFLLGAAILGAGLFIGLPSSNPNPPVGNTEGLEFEDGEDWDGENVQDNASDKVQESIQIPGYANLYVSSKNPNIRLINPDGNTVYMVYTISKDGEVLHKTKAIKPGQMINVDFKSFLSLGTHELTFTVSTYDVETQAPCNGATQSVSILVKE